MPNLVIFFVVIAATVPKIVLTHIDPQDVNAEKLIDILNQRINREESSADSSDSDDSDDSSVSSDNGASNLGRIGGEKILEIISKIADKNDGKSLKPAQLHFKVNRNLNIKNNDRANQITQILGQAINTDVESEEQASVRKPKKRLKPSRLLGDDLEESSTIYVLLDPLNMQKSKYSTSAIYNLVAKILDKSRSSKVERQVKPTQKRYKGFVVKENLVRRRGSREMYAPNDSEEEKPKRSHGRNNNGGGGGGHTAIPYIRHRGENIYEKD